MKYEPHTFTIPELKGISAESIKQHIGLYEGYVKNFNALSELMPELSSDAKFMPALSEVVRRRAFEFGGMRLHELYFSQFEGGAAALNSDSALAKQFVAEYKDAAHVLPYLKALATIRGPGWVNLYWDPKAKQLLAGFSEEQHQGHFATLPIILALDVWEHTYILDYGAAGRGKYVDAFFENLNWSVVEKRFEDVAK